jgi:WD40 repeat protein
MARAAQDHGRKWLRKLAGGAFLALAGLLLAGGGPAAEGGKALTPEKVRDVQAKYQNERQAAVSSGLAKKFPAAFLERADQLAKKGEAALAAGRLLEASEAFREARWQLPAVPTTFPPHVSLVLGSARLRHGPGMVGSLAFSPDGTRLVTATRPPTDQKTTTDYTVKVWDMGSGRELLTYTGHKKEINAVAFTPDGANVVSVGGDNTIHVWNASTGKDVHTIQNVQQSYLTGVAVSPDGKLIASCGNDGIVHLYEAATGKSKSNFSTRAPFLHAVAFSPDSQWLAAAAGDRVAYVWEVATGKQVLGINTGHGPGVRDVVFSPDGKLIATCGDDGTARTWNREGEQQQMMRCSKLVGCIAFSKDGKILATGSDDNNIRLWDVAGGQVLRTFQGHTGPVVALAFSPDGSQLVSSSQDQTVRLWQLDTFEQSHELTGNQDFVWSAAFSPDGRRVVSGGRDKTVRVWDWMTGKELLTLKGHTQPVTQALFSPDGKTIVSCGGDKVLRVWDANTGKALRTLPGHQGAVLAIAFSRDGKRLASGGADGLVKVWDYAPLTLPSPPAPGGEGRVRGEGRELLSLEGHRGVVSALAFSPDGKQLASGGADRTIRLWDPATGKKGAVLSGHASAVGGLAYSPDSRWLASCGGDHLVKLWSIRDDAAPGKTLAGHSGPLSAVAFSPDGRLLASAGADAIVKLWDVAAGAEARSFRGHKDWVTSVAFSPDGHFLVSASVDRTVRVWENAGREVLPTSGHTGDVFTVAVSPDGKTIASASRDGAIKLWDRATGVERQTLLGHEDAIMSLAFSPDGKVLASGGRDKTVRLWDPATGKAKRTIADLRGPVPSVSFTPDGKTLLVWVDSAETREGKDFNHCLIFVYNLAINGPPPVIDAHPGSVRALAFTRACNLAALGTDQGGVGLVTIKNGKGERVRGGDMPAYDDKAMIGDLIFTPDGKLLLTGGENGEIKVWDWKEREVLRSFKGHDKAVNAFGMSGDGKRFVTAGADRTVRLWETETGKELRRWDMGQRVWNLAFTPDDKHVVTGNENSTLYLLDLP